MKIVICGSMNFEKEHVEMSKKLKEWGFTAILPPSLEIYGKSAKELATNYDDYLKIRGELAKRHFNNIKDADAILVANYEKNGVAGYVGGATLAEMFFAFYNEKKIFMLNPIPEDLPHAEEISFCKPVILGQLEKITGYC